jgi:hypothetical protein
VKSASRWFTMLVFMVVLGCGPQIRSEKSQLRDLQSNLTTVEMSLAKETELDMIEQLYRIRHNLKEVIQMKKDHIRELKDGQRQSVKDWLGYGSDIFETVLGLLALGGLGIKK